MKRIFSYNVNGIRAALKKDFLTWMKQADPDILCIQETKAQNGQMSENEFEALGYSMYSYSAEKAGYSGVALLTKEKPIHVEYGMGNSKYDKEGRVIRADFGSFSVISAYFPSGTTGDARQAFKMDFLADFHGIVRLYRDLVRLRLNRDGFTRGLCGQSTQVYHQIGRAHV